ncbi:MAG: aldehyde dehydrogenase family protein [Acidimicrobiales bacterium]
MSPDPTAPTADLGRLEADGRAWIADAPSLYLDGGWRAPRGTDALERRRPDTGDRLASVRFASPADVDAAVAAAGAAFAPGSPWRTMSRRERAGVLHRIGEVVRANAEELAAIIALENGKLYGEALDDDMPDTADVFDHYAGWTDKLTGESVPVEGDAVCYVQREPIGPCALLVPWNFPLLLAAWKIAPALAMGNTVVVKPSPFTPFSLLRFAQLVDDAGILPPGVLNVVVGDREVGEALVAHPGTAKVSFTGSTAVGRAILAGVAGSNLAPVTLELGGKSPNVVFADTTDLDACIDRSFTLMFAQKGEKCSEPTRFILERSIHDRFVDALVERAEAVVCGGAFDPAATQGAQCTEAQLARIVEHIGIAIDEGAVLRCGGERDTSGRNAEGSFVRPTIFTDVTPGMRLFREEVFGPVLAVTAFDTEDEAVRLANATDYGLAAGVYTGDPSRARRVAGALDSGQVFINRYGCYDFAAPFGGVKASGWGREMGRLSLDAYTRPKTVWWAD